MGNRRDNRSHGGDTPTTSDESRHETDPQGTTARECHRRGCSREPAFRVLERYLEETGKGPVEATALLCRVHADDESPTNLDSAYDEYVFLVEPL